MLQKNGYLLKIFENIGFIEIVDGVLSDREYKYIYDLYDDLFYNSSNRYALNSIQSATRYWNSVEENSSSYTSAPVGFNDRRIRNDKEQKTYFQYCSDFGNYIKTLDAYNTSQVLRELIYELDRVVDITKINFKATLTNLEKELPNKIKKTFPDPDNMKILIKVISYHPSDQWATGVHYDKSALTLVHHGSDMENEPFCICSHNENPNVSEMLTPNRYIDDSDSPGIGILFPGLLFSLVGIKEIKASPHVVAKLFNKGRRYATIGFLMIPDLNANNLLTKV